MMMMAQVEDQQRRRGHDAYHLYNTTNIINGNSNSSSSSSTSTSTSYKKLKTATTATLLHANPKSISSKEKNDKFGERVAALQQLVSPFGKTDTASVLSEATGYIRFLHEQLQVLSAPYIGTPTMQNMQDEKYGLRRRGLCLMPVTATQSLSQSNGADLWAPTKQTSHHHNGVP